MFELRELGRNWEEDGVLISKHKTKELAFSRLKKEAKKRAKNVYYYNATHINDKNTLYDYGLWNKFLLIREVDDE